MIVTDPRILEMVGQFGMVAKTASGAIVRVPRFSYFEIETGLAELALCCALEGLYQAAYRQTVFPYTTRPFTDIREAINR